jgi:hypothetical protein
MHDRIVLPLLGRWMQNGNEADVMKARCLIKQPASIINMQLDLSIRHFNPDFPLYFCKILSPDIKETKTLSRGINWPSVCQFMVMQNGSTIMSINLLSLIATEMYLKSKKIIGMMWTNCM